MTPNANSSQNIKRLNKSPCSYSHLGSIRQKITKNMAQSNIAQNLIKKIDEYGKFMLNCCITSLKKFGSDEKLIEEILNEVRNIREKYIQNSNNTKSKIEI